MMEFKPVSHSQETELSSLLETGLRNIHTSLLLNVPPYRGFYGINRSGIGSAKAM